MPPWGRPRIHRGVFGEFVARSVEPSFVDFLTPSTSSPNRTPSWCSRSFMFGVIPGIWRGAVDRIGSGRDWG